MTSSTSQRLAAILTGETAPQIALGNYTTYGGNRYYVTKEPTVRKEHSRLYTVEVDLERSLGLARITILDNPVDHRTTFDYTGTATEHLQLIVDCLNAKYEEVGLKWTRGAVHCKDTVKHIKYDGATVLGAIQQIRETYETDISVNGETLSLGQTDDKTTAPTLAYGKGKGLLSGLERHKHTDDTVPSRLYVTGTKRNMVKGRLTLEKDVVLAVDLKNGAIERQSGGMSIKPDERTLYRTDPTGQYIAEWSPTDKFANSWRRFPTETTYTNEEIHPSHVSTIQTVTKVKDHFEVNSDFNYTKLLIDGEQMQVVFRMGTLAGREFDARHYTSTGRLAIVPKEEDDTTLPNDTLCPKVGDQYIVTGIKLPEQYIREAERKLTEEALRHLIKLQETRYSYKADIDPVYLHNNHDTIAPQLAVGRYVRLTDPQIAIGDPYVRIVGKRTYLDRPYTPEIELSNEIEPPSELTRVLNELDRQDEGIISLLDRLRGIDGELVLSSEEMRKHLDGIASHPLTIDKDGYWRIWNIKQQQYVTTQYQSRGRDGQDGKDGAKGDKGDKPVLTLNDKYQLLADGELLSQQSLKGADGRNGAPGKDGKSVTPQEVVSALNTDSFRESVSRLIDLNKLAASAASKVVGTSTLLTKIREGMATYSDLQSIKAQVDGHQVNWDTLEVNYIDPIRQLQNQLKAKQTEIEGNVDKDIIRFVYRAALQSEWSDYPSTEWVGNSGYHPDPWGGGAPEGYTRTVHHYELWRNMDSTPPIHIEQSKRTLRQQEYKVSGKPHRDGSATIVYDIQNLGGIESGRARHWRLFTTPHVTSILRYGGKTYMGNPSASGYTNLALDSGTTYDIYAYNSGGNKYELFIVKDGTYK